MSIVCLCRVTTQTHNNSDRCAKQHVTSPNHNCPQVHSLPLSQVTNQPNTIRMPNTSTYNQVKTIYSQTNKLYTTSHHEHTDETTSNQERPRTRVMATSDSDHRWRLPSITIMLLSAVMLCMAIVASAQPAPLKTNKIHQPKLKFPSPGVTYPSSGVHHLEPVLGYTIQHEDNAHLHAAAAERTLAAHIQSAYTNNAVQSLGAHSLKLRVREGLHQPFPEEVTLTFHAFDRRFHLPRMQLLTQLFVPHSKTIMHEGNSTKEIPNTLQSYYYVDATLNIQATATIHTNGLFHALVQIMNIDGVGETYQVDPLQSHEQHVDGDVLQNLSDASPHGIVIFKHTDVKDTSQTHLCGAVKQPTVQKQPESGADVDEEAPTPTELDDSSSTESSGPMHLEPQPSSRRLLSALGTNIEYWANCYPSEGTPQKVSIGVATDVSYYNIYGSLAATQAAIAAAYANINLVYTAQFHIFLQLDQVLIMSTSGTYDWNNAPVPPSVRCTITIQDDLNALTAWRKSVNPTKDALWHLLTNCFPPAGTVGLAWVASLCSSDYGAGVSSYSQVHWLTIAHETGHGFGGTHDFENGVGSTGGIMDYGNGQYPVNSGIIQFSTVYNEKEMCAEMTSALTTPGFSPFCSAPYTPTCGNNVIEVGEDCDDSSSCCVGCKYVSGGVCSMGVGGLNTCCDSTTCQFKPSSVLCGVKSPSTGHLQGYCSNGACTPSACDAFSNLEYCGIKGANACRQTCLSSGSCTDSFTTPNLNMPDGVVCSIVPYSTCVSGVCTATSTTPPTPTITYSWVITGTSLCSCNGTQTRTIQCQDSIGAIAASSSLCTGTAPSSTQTCQPSTTMCVHWKAGGFGNCSVDCGQGTQTQTVNCVKTNSPSTIVSSSFCTAASMPPTLQVCTASTNCPTPVSSSTGSGNDSSSTGLATPMTSAGVLTQTDSAAGGGSSSNTGVVAGVSVGAICIVVAVGIIGVVLYRRRRRSSHASAANNSHIAGDAGVGTNDFSGHGQSMTKPMPSPSLNMSDIRMSSPYGASPSMVELPPPEWPVTITQLPSMSPPLPPPPRPVSSPMKPTMTINVPVMMTSSDPSLSPSPSPTPPPPPPEPIRKRWPTVQPAYLSSSVPPPPPPLRPMPPTRPQY